MEMHQVRYFLAVADALNFTRAAERCNVSQPALTRAIRLLEDELGGPLFNRERRHTHLTELGRTILPYLRDIGERASEAKREAAVLARQHHVVLKLGLMCTIAPNRLVDLVRGVRARHPAMAVEVVDATAGKLIEDLLAGNLGVAVCCHPESEGDERLHKVPLFRERFVIVLDPGHPLARRNVVEMRDLHGESYLERTHCEYAQRAELIFKEQGVVDHTVYRSDRDDWILAMAAAGLGYAFMPEQSATHPAVAVRPLTNPEIWRDVSLMTVRGRQHSAGVGALIAEAIRWRRAAAPA